MSAFFESGLAVDLVLVFVLIEALLIFWHYLRSGRGLAPGPLLSLLVPGACLLLALRAALTGADWSWLALWLIAALLAHLADLKQRWRG